LETHSKELEEKPVLAVTELKLYDAIRPDLGHLCYPSRVQELSDASDESRGLGGGRAREVGQVASEA
jgi:hypothetical protein